MKRNVINVVIGVIVAMALGLAGCGGGGGTTSTNAAVDSTTSSIVGTWMMYSSDKGSTYLIADTNGNAELGGIGVKSGTYSKQADGTYLFSITQNSGSPISFPVTLTSSTTGTATANGTTSTITKVSNVAACQGKWNGAFAESAAGGNSYTFTITVDSTGSITSSSGQLVISAGKIFSEAGKVASRFIITGKPGYDNIRFNSGTLIGNSITGTYSADDSTKSGTLNLTKTQ